MSPGIRRGVRFCFALCALACELGACTFPDYVARDMPGGGTPGAGGSGKPATAGEGADANGGEATSGASTGGASTAGTTSAGGEGGAAGEPTVVDIGPCGQRKFALHCYDHEQNEDESDVDCGGSRCPDCAANESCNDDRDCSSGSCIDGACSRTFEVAYHQLTPDLETPAFHLEAQIKSLTDTPRPLKDIKVRYYFSRNFVAEPILASGTANIEGGADVTVDTTWSIVRQIRGDGISNDAYLEVGFTSGRILTLDQVLRVLPRISAGTSEPFNQSTHHSYDADSALHESSKLSVHFAGKRMWGRGPAADDPPSCLLEGVNLDGAAEVVGGEQWLASPASVQERYQDVVNALKPPTDQGREDMLRAGFLFRSDSFTYPVADGEYALILYAWSAALGDLGTIQAQGADLDEFQCQSFEGGSAWAPLGPYRITVDDGQLKLSSQGVVPIGGLELRRLDE